MNRDLRAVFIMCFKGRTSGQQQIMDNGEDVMSDSDKYSLHWQHKTFAPDLSRQLRTPHKEKLRTSHALLIKAVKHTISSSLPRQL